MGNDLLGGVVGTILVTMVLILGVCDTGMNDPVYDFNGFMPEDGFLSYFSSNREQNEPRL